MKAKYRVRSQLKFKKKNLKFFQPFNNLIQWITKPFQCWFPNQ